MRGRGVMELEAKGEGEGGPCHWLPSWFESLSSCGILLLASG